MNNADNSLLDVNIGISSIGNRCAPGIARSRIALAKAQLKRVCNFQDDLLTIGRGLISYAEHAYAFKNMASLAEISELLLSMPCYYMAGLYYRALTIKRKGRARDAESLLIKVAETAALGIRARALQTLGTLQHERGEMDTALRFYKEATQVASAANENPPVTLLWTLGNLSAFKSSQGDHKAALADLESLFPLVRIASAHNPYIYYDYHNNIAAELISLGKIEKARRASEIATGSIYAPAYPAWEETRREIALSQSDRTLVPVPAPPLVPKASNIIPLHASILALASRSSAEQSNVKGALLPWRTQGDREKKPKLRARISIFTEDDQQVIFDDAINERQLDRLLDLADEFTRARK